MQRWHSLTGQAPFPWILVGVAHQAVCRALNCLDTGAVPAQQVLLFLFHSVLFHGSLADCACAHWFWPRLHDSCFLTRTRARVLAMASRKVARFKGRKFRKHTTCQRAEIRVDCRRAFRKCRRSTRKKPASPSKQSDNHLTTGVAPKGTTDKLYRKTAALARRMLAGRTLCRLQNLQRMSLLSTLRGLDSGASNIQPAAGLTATLQGQAVLILDSFLRRGPPICANLRCGAYGSNQ